MKKGIYDNPKKNIHYMDHICMLLSARAEGANDIVTAFHRAVAQRAEYRQRIVGFCRLLQTSLGDSTYVYPFSTRKGQTVAEA